MSLFRPLLTRDTIVFLLDTIYFCNAGWAISAMVDENSHNPRASESPYSQSLLRSIFG